MLPFKNPFKAFKKFACWEKFFYIALFVLVIIIINNYVANKNGIQEGFKQTSEFIVKKGSEIYDDFYVKIYDDLVYNQIKNDFEIGTIVETTQPDEASIILDVGSGTGHHVKEFTDKGFNAQGIDISPSMIAKANKNYPDLDYQNADALKPMTFAPNSFTHITCLYFTIYYIQNKRKFIQNCFNWLMPGGYLVLHLVDKDKFDPILPVGDPFSIVSPQTYSNKRITSTVVKFDQFDYKSNFEIFPNDTKARMSETFKDNTNGTIRKNEHNFYMPTQKEILSMAKDQGFILLSKIDMIKCQYSEQYLYVLQKPN